MDQAQLIAQVMTRTGVRLSEDDPAFAIVELNKLVLEDMIERAGSRLDPLADRIDKVARIAAADVTRSSLAAIARETLQARDAIQAEAREAAHRARADAEAARAQAMSAVSRALAASTTAARLRFVVIGLGLAAVVAAAAYVAGYLSARPAEQVRSPVGRIAHSPSSTTPWHQAVDSM